MIERLTDILDKEDIKKYTSNTNVGYLSTSLNGQQDPDTSIPFPPQIEETSITLEEQYIAHTQDIEMHNHDIYGESRLTNKNYHQFYIMVEVEERQEKRPMRILHGSTTQGEVSCDEDVSTLVDSFSNTWNGERVESSKTMVRCDVCFDTFDSITGW
jgi:hypothetical protein